MESGAISRTKMNVIAAPRDGDARDDNKPDTFSTNTNVSSIELNAAADDRPDQAEDGVRFGSGTSSSDLVEEEHGGRSSNICPKATASNKFHLQKALVILCTASITTSIGSKLPALRAHLTDYHLAELNDFVAEYYTPPADNEDPLFKAGDNFLSRNSLSVCAKLYLPMLREIRDERVIPIRRLQLAEEVDRMEKARDLDELVEEKKEKAEARVTVKEGRKRGGIGMIDGKVVFGPVKPREMEDEDEDDGPPTAMSLYVNKDSLDVMGRLVE